MTNELAIASLELSKNTARAVEKYGKATCLSAVRMNDDEGEGPSTVAIYLSLSGVAAGNAAINAGREIREIEAARNSIEKYGAEICLEARRMADFEGIGCRTIADRLGFANYLAACEAIDAGRKIEKLPA